MRAIALAALVLVLPAHVYAENHFPLIKGEIREYRVTDNGKPGTSVSEVVAVETRNGKLTAKVIVTTNGIGRGDDYVVDSSGVRKVSAGGIAADVPVTLLKYPVRVGDHWTTRQKWPDGLVAVNETCVFPPVSVTVPAGKFTAYPVVTVGEIEGLDVMAVTWYADGVGIVKFTSTIGGKTRTSELVKYTPKR